MDRSERERLYRLLRRWNPWWRGAEFEQGIRRELLPSARSWLESPQALAICGLRQAGKTTLMRQLVGHLLEEGRVDPSRILFVNFEDYGLVEEVTRPGFLDDLMAVYREYLQPAARPFLFLDEIQNVKDWGAWVRTSLELDDARIVLSGSSSRLLEPELGAVLTGRSIQLTLWPFSFAEFLEAQHIAVDDEVAVRRAVLDYMRSGGLPRVATERPVEGTDETRRRILAGLFQDLLYRDVLSRHEVRAVKQLEQLAVHYLSQTGRDTSFGGLRKRYGMATHQASAYTEFLEQAYLIRALSRFAWKLTVQRRAPRKYYATDTGLRNAVAFRFSPDLGPLAETLVHNQLLRLELGDLYYFRDKQECDFVVWRDERPRALVQVCYGSGPLPAREVAGLQAALRYFGERHAEVPAFMVTDDEEREEVLDGHRIRFLPLWKFLLADAGSIVDGVS
ncbi:MAG: ATP-binding protein [Myxococcota bacterium]